MSNKILARFVRSELSETKSVTLRFYLLQRRLYAQRHNGTPVIVRMVCVIVNERLGICKAYPANHHYQVVGFALRRNFLAAWRVRLFKRYAKTPMQALADCNLRGGLK